MLDYCERERLVFIPWMPLGDGSIPWVDPALMALAGTHGVTPAQIALSALLRHSDAILPIPGTSSRSHIQENVPALDIDLSYQNLKSLW